MSASDESLLDHWQLLEADFLREYGLDLNEVVTRISWRRFMALVSGLSPNSAFRMVVSETPKLKPLSGLAAAAALHGWNQ
jgi:hypothetical protein